MPLDAEHKEQDRWIKTLVDKMDDALCEEACNQIMEKCGRQCIPSHVISEAARAYSQASDIDDFLTRLNEMKMNGGNLSREGNIIQIRCEKFYCGCSLGWNKAFFEAIFQRPVDVKLVESIVSGADRCLIKADLVFIMAGSAYLPAI